MNTLARQEIAGYWRQTPITARPDFVICRGDARRLQAERKGVLLNHGKAFRMWTGCAEDSNPHYRLRDASCCMHARIIEANADGDRRAMALTDGWRREGQGDLGTRKPGDPARTQIADWETGGRGIGFDRPSCPPRPLTSTNRREP